MKNRRKYKRIRGGIKFIFKFLHKKGEEELLSFDVSAGGVSVPLKERIKVGTDLELALILPGESTPFCCIAKVAWQADNPKKGEKGDPYFDTGLSFIRMNPNERKQLIHYVYNSVKEKKG